MTHGSYFQNFFGPLCAALSDDAFLAFAATALLNIKRDAATHAADIAYLEPLVNQLRAAHAARGPQQGKSATATTLRQAVRQFLAWAKLTNTQRVFPAFPDRQQTERVAIFPGGMEVLYRADKTNLLSRAKHYLDAISSPAYGSLTKVTPAEAQLQYQKLVDALGGRTTAESTAREAIVAVDAEEERVCVGLYRAYAGLLLQHFAQPERAYAYFPFPQTTGDPAEDDNLPSLPSPK